MKLKVLFEIFDDLTTNHMHLSRERHYPEMDFTEIGDKALETITTPQGLAEFLIWMHERYPDDEEYKKVIESEFFTNSVWLMISTRVLRRNLRRKGKALGEYVAKMTGRPDRTKYVLHMLDLTDY